MFFSGRSNRNQMQVEEPSSLPLNSSLKDLTGQSHLSSKGSVVLSSSTMVKTFEAPQEGLFRLWFMFLVLNQEYKMSTPTHNAMSSGGKFTSTTALVPRFQTDFHFSAHLVGLLKRPSWVHLCFRFLLQILFLYVKPKWIFHIISLPSEFICSRLVSGLWRFKCRSTWWIGLDFPSFYQEL